MANGPPEEGAYQCFFNRDDLPSPMEGGTLCDFPLAQLSGFPDHEEHFPLYTGARLEDMVESIRRHGVQSPILVWKTAEGTYIIISGHNRVNASKIAGLTTIPAVIRTDLTQETAEDLFYEMNFRQRSLADMLFSQRVLCIAAHYNMLKRQGRRTDLQTFETTSPDTQEKSHTDVKIAQEYELTRDKVSKYCRYATLYRPLLLLMNSGKRLGQLAAYEISFVEDHSLQECIYQFISEGSASISTAKGKKLRAAFEDGKLDASQIKSILSGGGLSTSKQPGRRVSVTLPPAFAPYFPPKATTKQIEETIQSKSKKPYKKPWLCISRPWEMLHSPVKQIGSAPLSTGSAGSFFLLFTGGGCQCQRIFISVSPTHLIVRPVRGWSVWEFCARMAR